MKDINLYSRSAIDWKVVSLYFCLYCKLVKASRFLMTVVSFLEVLMQTGLKLNYCLWVIGVTYVSYGGI